MGFYISDPEILEILTRYAREVREERMRSSWALIYYAHEEMEMRITILKAFG